MAEAVRAAGYDFWLMVFDNRGRLLLKTRLLRKRHRRYRRALIVRARSVGSADVRF